MRAAESRVHDAADPAGTARVGTTWAVWGTVLRLLPVAAAAVCAVVLAVAGLLRG